MDFATQNNHLLPLASDPDPDFDFGDGGTKRFVANEGVKARMRYEKTPDFTTMNRHFWVEHFMSMPVAQLREYCRTLDLPIAKNKAGCVTVLSNHFRNLILQRQMVESQRTLSASQHTQTPPKTERGS